VGRVVGHERLAIHDVDMCERILKSVEQFEAGEKWSKAFRSGNEQILDSLLLVARLAIIGGLDAQKVFTKSDLRPFIKMCQDRKISIERELKVKLRDDIDRDPVKMLNVLLKLIGQKVENVKTTKVGRAKVYRYKLNTERYERLKSIVDRRKRKELSYS
jgi:hypothetical protein